MVVMVREETLERRTFAVSLLDELASEGELTFGELLTTVGSSRATLATTLVELNQEGEQATYIPPLAEVNPDQFGLATLTSPFPECRRQGSRGCGALLSSETRSGPTGAAQSAP